MATLDFHMLIEKAREAGYVYLFGLTRIDHLVAMALMGNLMKKNDIDVVATFNPGGVEEPAVLIGVGKLPGFTGFHYAVKSLDGSYSMGVLRLLEEVWVVNNRAKSIALLGAADLDMDRGKEGLRGFPGTVVSELESENVVEERIGFRFWIDDSTSLDEAAASTIIPFLPGLTGDVEASSEFMKKALGVDDPSTVSFEEFFSNIDSDLLKRFVAGLIDVMSREGGVPREYLMSVLGKIYRFKIFPRNPYLRKLYGLLAVYCAVDDGSVLRVPFMLDADSLFTEIRFTYSYLVGNIAEEVAVNIMRYRETRDNVFASHYVVRPEIYVSVLRGLGWLPQRKPVIIERGGQHYTVLSEILRVYGKIDTGLAVTDEQLVEVKPG